MYAHGEILALKDFPLIDYQTFGQDGWVYRDQLSGEHLNQAAAGLSAVRAAMKSAGYDLIIMDEVNVAIDMGLLSVAEVKQAILARPAGTEVILTGRNADPELIEMAATVTEMCCVKHAYDSGIQASKGIDY